MTRILSKETDCHVPPTTKFLITNTFVPFSIYLPLGVILQTGSMALMHHPSSGFFM